MGLLLEKLENCRRAASLEDTLNCVDALIREISPELFRYVRRRCKPEVAEEVCQETVMTIALRHKKFQGSDEVQFRSWCYRILFNKISDYFRKEGRYQLEPFDEVEISDTLAARNDELAPGVWEDLEYAMRLLSTHDGECRELLWLRHAIGLEIKLIAEMNDRNYDAMRMKLTRCLELAQSLVAKYP